MPPFLLFVPLLIMAAGCTQFPQIDARVPEAERTGPPPALIDVLPLLAQADAAQRSQRLTPATGAALGARAQALSAQAAPHTARPARPAAQDARLQALTTRAEALRAAPVIAPADRDRLETGAIRPAALQ
ncbi:hypothetical protein [Limimaricola hongkongensis]|uniref:Uncharacterized protein n=1 Tax=Limimaricola hongkongensis DSM 17492 TaxID=1122180 RepID=A0A017HEX8_9RHOB|nr:hypothetical protein [Limimaricola hongkongensis]EYD72703.1 hypothetical protein Lokhon_01506 [Limimaricola hongkongensis DSM 17492]